MIRVPIVPGDFHDALGRLRAKSGSYSLFLVGLEIESLVRLKSHSKPDYDRNTPLDADQLFGKYGDACIFPHRGMIVLAAIVCSAVEKE